MVAENCSGRGGAAVDREEVNDGEKQRRTETGCMGRGYLGQGLRPSSGLIHALLKGVGAPRCVCVSHARHRGGGAWLPKTERFIVISTLCLCLSCCLLLV